MGDIFLVTGGCRSGKSGFALQQSMKFEKRYYLATAQSFDQEMSDRIERHQRERLDNFITIEEPIHIVGKFPDDGPNSVILWDCLTLWLSNLLMTDRDDDQILKQLSQVINRLKIIQPTCYIVSNEVGMGIVPENPLGRRFRDLVGWAHQHIMPEAKEVFQISMGIPLPLKRLSHDFFP